MGKRKEHSEDKIRRKIRKLEEKLKKKHKSHIIYSSDEEYQETNDLNYVETEEVGTYNAPEILLDQNFEEIFDNIPVHVPDHVLEPTTEGSKVVENPEPSTSTPTVPPANGSVMENEPHLQEDILQLLGDAPEPETNFGKAIHQEIATRWQDILKKGLNKDIKEKICKDYLVPSNCELLVPPILNAEAKAALNEQSVKRDASLVYRQKQLGFAVSALSQTIQAMISNNEPAVAEFKQKCLKPISDACRLLCDLHNGETKIRRKFVISSINTSLRDTLINTSSDKFLFGDNMSEKLKAAQTVQKSGDALKAAPRPQLPKGNMNKTRPNFRPLQPRIAGRPDAGRILQAARYQPNNIPPQARRPRQRSPQPQPPPRRILTRRH